MKILLLFALFAWAVDNTTEDSREKIRYKKGKDIDFSTLLIEGHLRRPELSVVTGRTEQGGDGLLRLRTNFLDKMTDEFGETIP